MLCFCSGSLGSGRHERNDHGEGLAYHIAFNATCRDNQQCSYEVAFRPFFEPLMSLTFDDAFDDSYGSIRSDLARSGTPLDPNYLLIAATAVANDLALVVASSKELRGVAGLSIENWKIGN